MSFAQVSLEDGSAEEHHAHPLRPPANQQLTTTTSITSIRKTTTITSMRKTKSTATKRSTTTYNVHNITTSNFCKLFMYHINKKKQKQHQLQLQRNQHHEENKR